MGAEIIRQLLPLAPIPDKEPMLPGMSPFNRETLWILAQYFKVEMMDVDGCLNRLLTLGLLEATPNGYVRVSRKIGAKLAQSWFAKYGEMRRIIPQMAQSGGYISSLSSLIFKGGMGEKEVEEEFEALWKIWPEKKDRIDAWLAYKLLRKSHAREELEKAVFGYADYLKTQRVHRNFDQRAKYLKTFLHKNRWKEYLDEHYNAPL